MRYPYTSVVCRSYNYLADKISQIRSVGISGHADKNTTPLVVQQMPISDNVMCHVTSRAAMATLLAGEILYRCVLV